MRRAGWGCGAEISGVECLIRRILLVGFLSLGSVVSAVQSRHHLASWNATEQGVEGSLMLQGGWVMAERCINSSSTNHLMPTKLF